MGVTLNCQIGDGHHHNQKSANHQCGFPAFDKKHESNNQNQNADTGKIRYPYESVRKGIKRIHVYPASRLSLL